MNGPRTSRDDLDEIIRTVGRIGACYSPSFSPSGSHVAFVSNMSGSPQIWTVPTAGGLPTLVPPFDDPVIAVSWSPEGSWLAASTAPGGGLNHQVHVLRTDGSARRQLSAGGRDNNWLDGWTHDGAWLRVSSSRDGPDSLDAYLVDPVSGDWRLVARNHGIGQLPDVSRDGRRALVIRQANRGDNDLVLVDLERRREVVLTPHAPPASFLGGYFSSDDATVYLSSNRDSDRLVLARLHIDPELCPGEIEVIAARDDAELEMLAVSPAGDRAVLGWNVAGRNGLEFVDLASLHRSPGPPLPSEIAAELTFSADGCMLAMTLSGSAAPRDVWVLDAQSGKFTQLTHSPHDGVDLSALPRPELVRFCADDGLPLSGWLYRPVGATGREPFVLNFHGGPELQERPSFNSLYQSLLASGIGIFAPNVRGSSGFGKQFTNLDNGRLRFDAIRDIRACVDHLVSSGAADSNRLGIMGASYGGYMTLWGLAEYPEAFAAGANLFGLVNFETFFANTEPWVAAISKVEYGDPAADPDLMRRLSPIHQVDRIRAPMLVVHGANDTNVPVYEAEQVVSSLKRRGIPVEYVLFPDEGHGIQQTRNRLRVISEVTRWFVERLNPA